MRFIIILLLTIGSLKAQEVDFKIKVYVDDQENEVKILADNDEPFPISLSLEVNLKGASLAESLKDFYVLPPNTTGNLLSIIVKPTDNSWSYRFGYTFGMGNAFAEHDDSYAYKLPFPSGKSYILTQGYNGRTTHSGLNALDFTMPEGDTISAAREGIVVRIKEDSNRGCPSSNCANDGNYVTILHEDGTLADYVHLKQNGVLVEIGDQIKRGQKIAINGATGWASGAHLHFVVYTTGKQAQETIQVKFETELGKVESLTEGNQYTAFFHD